MRGVRQSSTAPELKVRSYLHAHGLRFSLNRKSLPGSPDLVLRRRSTVVFVHGCFWHAHECAHGSVKARTNIAFWEAKLSANKARDVRNVRALRNLGWMVEIVWECQLRDARRLAALARCLLRR
jgi:DNA mismatch endonuclease (patch repair protein)